MIIIKTDNEINKMRDSGKILSEVLNEMINFSKVGVSTYEIDMYGLSIIKKYKAVPSFYHLYDFPANFCISINDEVIHGIPKKDVILKEGDIVSIDGGVCYKGYHSDAARTFGIGKISNEASELILHTKESFFEGIKKCYPSNYRNDISTAIDDYISKFGYGIIEDYVGHGIGKEVHEEPDVPNYKTKEKGPKLYKNMTLAIEPMIALLGKEVYVDDDDWTVKTVDGSITCHYENTVVITDNGPEILSL